MNYTLINQKFIAKKNATISIEQRACRFGDGIFETCKIIDGVIYDYKSHEARILKGLKALQISAKIKDLKNDSYHLIKKNQIKNGILRISISRGIGSLGYLPAKKIEPLIIIETSEERKISDQKIVIDLPRCCLGQCTGQCTSLVGQCF
jgi:branched-subunit amino acid aminotransferase/4-amino-4-deoxychorismate lyase